MIVEHLAYNPMETPQDGHLHPGKAEGGFQQGSQDRTRHIYDYVFTDSKNERDLRQGAGLPAPKLSFTPSSQEASPSRHQSGQYSPDWAIAFQARRGKTHLLHRGDKGSTVIDGHCEKLRSAKSSAPGNSSPKYVRPGEIRRGGQLQQADGAGTLELHILDQELTHQRRV